MPACSATSSNSCDSLGMTSKLCRPHQGTAGRPKEQTILPVCCSAFNSCSCSLVLYLPSTKHLKPQQDTSQHGRSALSAHQQVDSQAKLGEQQFVHQVNVPQECLQAQQQPLLQAPSTAQAGLAGCHQHHQHCQPTCTAHADAHFQCTAPLHETSRLPQPRGNGNMQPCEAVHDTLHEAVQYCRHPQRHKWHARLLLPFLSFLLLSTLPLGLLPTAQGQQISCPCWPSPDAQGGCDASHTMTYTSSSSLVGISVSQCMPLPQYDSRWAALVLHVCWNTSCLPSGMAGSVLTTMLPAFSTGLNSIPAGEYELKQVSPPNSGIDAISAAITLSSNSSSTDVSAGSTFVVPSTHVKSINATWVWPSTMTTGNWAQTILQSLDAVSLNGAAPNPAAMATDNVCADVLQPTGDPLNPAECADGLVPLYVWSKADDFSDANYASYPMTHITNTTNVTRCITPPSYDPYSQQLLWNLTWCTACYPDGMTTPMLISLNATSLPGMSWLPTNSSMQLTTRSSLYQFTNSFGYSVVNALLAMGSQDETENSVVTTLTAPSTTLFVTPESGVNNISMGVQLTGRISTVANGSLLFLMNRSPFTLDDVDSIRLQYQTLDWSATLLVAGVQSAGTLAALQQYLGAQGSISPQGWQLTLPVLFRDYSIVWDCSDSSLDGLLNAVAASVGLSRSFITASCEALNPGGAADVLTTVPLPASVSLSSSATGSNTTGRRRLSEQQNSWSWSAWRPHIQTAVGKGLLGAADWRAGSRRLLQSNTTATNSTANSTTTTNSTTATTNSTTAAPASTVKSNSTLSDNAGLCGDARILVNITYTFFLNDSIVAQLAAGEQLALTPLLVAAESQFLAGAGYALSDYDANAYCTSSLSIDTLALMKGGNVGEQDYDLTDALCQSSAQQATTIIQAMTSGYGLQVSLEPNSVTCTGDYICVDCWPYSIPQWAIVLMACAAMLAIVVLLAIRLKIVKRMEARQRVPAGQLDIERNVKQVQQVQLEEKEAEARLAAEGEIEEEEDGQEEILSKH